jgi:K+-sensing histidine kinase KdpD
MNTFTDLEKIYNLSLHFLTPVSLEETYKIVAEEAKHLLSAEYSTILLHNKKHLERVYSTSPIIEKTKVRKGGRTYRVFRDGKPFVAKVRKKTDINLAQYMLRVKSIIFIPLTIQDETIGVLNVLSRKDYTLAPQDLFSLQIFGAMASLSIHNAYLLEESKRAIEMRDLFFAAASHELKTPTTTIKLYGQLVKKDIEKKKIPKSAWVKILLNETERVTKLVNQFLMVNKIKTGHLDYQFKNHSLKEIVESACISFKANHPNPLIFQNKLKRKEDSIRTDADKLLEAIINVLDNAAKYSAPDANIILTLSYKTPHFIISIKDHGQGIRKKDLTKIFSIFFKATSNVKEGIGLGLFLTKSIIEGHQGKIKITSKFKEGTTIKMLLPETELGKNK